MPIKKLTPQDDTQRYVDGQMERLLQAVVYNLQHIGEQCVNHARSLPSPPAELRGTPHAPHYIDDSGNLRASIGYVVAVDGKVVQADGFKGAQNGASEGAAYASDLVHREFPHGIVLILVAGMRYAAYLSARGYDVIDSAELLADRLVPQLLSQLGFKLSPR